MSIYSTAWPCRQGVLCPAASCRQAVRQAQRRLSALLERPSKPWRLRCLAVPPGTEASRRCADQGAAAGAGGDDHLKRQKIIMRLQFKNCGRAPRARAGAGGDGELGPQAVSGKAGHAGPGPGSGSFRGLSRRGRPGAWPPPARPSYRRRRQARPSQGGRSRGRARPTEQSRHGPLGGRD